jgi:hypothetical protein
MSHVDSIFGGPQKKIVPTEPTIRLEVELEKTSKDSFPEFSYLSLKKELNSNRETAEKENKDTTNLGNFLCEVFFAETYRLIVVVTFTSRRYRERSFMRQKK